MQAPQVWKTRCALEYWHRHALLLAGFCKSRSTFSARKMFPAIPARSQRSLRSGKLQMIDFLRDKKGFVAVGAFQFNPTLQDLFRDIAKLSAETALLLVRATVAFIETSASLGVQRSRQTFTLVFMNIAPNSQVDSACNKLERSQFFLRKVFQMLNTSAVKCEQSRVHKNGHGFLPFSKRPRRFCAFNSGALGQAPPPLHEVSISFVRPILGVRGQGPRQPEAGDKTRNSS